MPVRFVMVGGFLGAGKTTTLARLARTYHARGQRVAVVTNDQAHDLVDTNALRAQGFAVEEVPGACFCCRFEDLVSRIGSLETSERPDIILAEPVGSCTDLIATVVQPLKDLYHTRFVIAPYAVVFKPSHGLRILRNDPRAGFSPKAAYIFRKQLEEADAIVINRIDELPPADLAELIERITHDYPNTPVLTISAQTGERFETLVELLDQDGAYGRKILSIDYDTYAEGEAELGWLNASVELHAEKPFDLDALVLSVVQDLARRISTLEAEVAHLKVIGQDDGGAFCVANVVSRETPAKLSLTSGAHPQRADLIVNARVAIDPSILEAEVQSTLRTACAAANITPTFRQSQSLRPGRPTPTHRDPRAIEEPT